MDNWPETVRFLHTVPSLALLSEEEMEQLRPYLRHRTLVKGENVYRQGQGTDYLYFIRQGRIKVSQTANGRNVIVGFYGPSELLGCCGLVGDVCYPCYAQAIESATLVFISREAFERLLSGVPAVAAKLLSQMVSRLREAHCKMKSLALEPVEERVIAVLLELGEKFGNDQDGKVTLPAHITREQISEMAGTTIETTSRVISKLRQAGLVECPNRCTILDSELLGNIVERPGIRSV
jgi:CRP-like cAMP-binding protein